MAESILSENLSRQLDEWMARSPEYTFCERISLLLESEPLYQEQPYAVRYGNTLGHILDRVSLPIDGEELLLGRVAERIPTPEEWEATSDVYKSWWEGRPLADIQEDILWFYSKAWLRCRPPWFYSFGHLALDWKLLISEGIEGFERIVHKSQAKYKDARSVQFLEGALLSQQAVSRYIARYAEAATQAGRLEDADSLMHISRGAPRTFSEALQLLWLMTIVSQKVCGCGVLNYSRMDQYLLPLYRKDVQEGRLSPQAARTLLQEFYFKNNEIMANTDHMSLDIESTTRTLEVTFDDPNYIILGGLLPDGRSGVNELSGLMIQAAADLKLKNPFVVVRWHNGIDQDFFQQVCAAMRDNATIVVYSDEQMIPALRKCGIQEPEIYDYGFFGCNDPIIPGEEGGLRQMWLNLVRPLELALNEGDYPLVPGGENRDLYVFPLEDRLTGLMTGPYYGTATLPLDKTTRMEDVLDAYRAQVRYLMHGYRQGIERDMELEKRVNADRLRFEDCFLHGTLENAVTWNNGGTKYHHIVVQGSGIATVADALYAIDKLVFQDKACTLSEFNDILKADWEGNESLHQRVLHLPKFGNDVDEVDKYATFVSEVFADAVHEEDQGRYLYGFLPTLSSDRDFTTMGMDLGATPDGRASHAPISENQSPAEGADLSGITALLNSASKIRFDEIAGGPLNLRLHPSAVQGENGAKLLTALLNTYFQKGGLQIQMNVVDKETLIQAQKEPEKHRNLCVRVTGYSAFFTQMGKRAQDEMIKRTEQAF